MLDLQYFNFCPMQQHPVLGMFCRACQHLRESDGDYYCGYDEGPETEGYLIRDLINRLLECLEAGEKSLSREELLALLDD